MIYASKMRKSGVQRHIEHLKFIKCWKTYTLSNSCKTFQTKEIINE